jgi:hypothetical protein
MMGRPHIPERRARFAHTCVVATDWPPAGCTLLDARTVHSISPPPRHTTTEVCQLAMRNSTEQAPIRLRLVQSGSERVRCHMPDRPGKSKGPCESRRTLRPFLRARSFAGRSLHGADRLPLNAHGDSRPTLIRRLTHERVAPTQVPMSCSAGLLPLLTHRNEATFSEGRRPLSLFRE